MKFRMEHKWIILFGCVREITNLMILSEFSYWNFGREGTLSVTVYGSKIQPKMPLAR